MLRKFGVQKLLTFIVVAWGIVQLGMGFVHAWGWLVLCRVLLGIFEVWQIFFLGGFDLTTFLIWLQAAFFPALLFILTTWFISLFQFFVIQK